MKREETKIIEQTLYRNLFGNNPKLAKEYGTNEVTLGFSRDGRINNGKTEIVDFLSYDVRKDLFRCYEIKVTMSDFRSHAATQSSDYDDVIAHAGEVQQKVAEQTGVTTTDLQIDRDKLENDSQVAVSLGVPGTYQSGIAMGRNFGQTSSFMARAGAVTEFTSGGTTDYVQWMIQTAADDSVGYSQEHRFMNPDVDCASFVFYALQNTGYNVSGYPFTTANMGDILVSIA